MKSKSLAENAIELCRIEFRIKWLSKWTPRTYCERLETREGPCRYVGDEVERAPEYKCENCRIFDPLESERQALLTSRRNCRARLMSAFFREGGKNEWATRRTPPAPRVVKRIRREVREDEVPF
jgi:hypothetical protein